MKITSEMLEKAEQCKTAEELVILAKENSVNLSLEEAKSLLVKKGKKKLTAEEIDTVVAGLRPAGTQNEEK